MKKIKKIKGKHEHKMKKGDMEMSSIKLQFANIYCNNHMLSKQIMWTFKTRLDAQRKEKVINKTKDIKNLTMVSYQLPKKKESNTAEAKIIQQKTGKKRHQYYTKKRHQ